MELNQNNEKRGLVNIFKPQIFLQGFSIIKPNPTI